MSNVDTDKPNAVSPSWAGRSRTLAAWALELVALGLILIGMGHAPVFLGYYAFLHLSRGHLPPQYTASLVWMPLVAGAVSLAATVSRSEIWRSRLHVMQACIMLVAGWWALRHDVDFLTASGWTDLQTITAIPLAACCGVGICTGVVWEVRWRKARRDRAGL